MANEYTALKKSRYERKFVVSQLSKANIEQIVRAHPAAFSEIYHERYINNIYLDSHNLMSYIDNNVGKSHRKKVRIRWYGDLLGYIEHPILEFKLKTGAVGDKHSFFLKSFVLDKNFNIDLLKNIFKKSDLPDRVMDEILTLEPTLLNRYSRKYFQTIDKNFRLTIDTDLEYHDISRRNNNFIKHDINYIDNVVELKYENNKDNKADFITNNLPFRMTKSSKYVNGIEKFHLNIAI